MDWKIIQGIDFKKLKIMPEDPFLITCSLCKKIMLDPICCKNCKECYCRACIAQYVDCNLLCVCGKCFNYSHDLPDKLFDALNKLLFKCKYIQNGCLTLLGYKQFLKHEKTCSYRFKRTSQSIRHKLTFQIDNFSIFSPIMSASKTTHHFNVSKMTSKSSKTIELLPMLSPGKIKCEICKTNLNEKEMKECPICEKTSCNKCVKGCIEGLIGIRSNVINVINGIKIWNFSLDQEEKDKKRLTLNEINFIAGKLIYCKTILSIYLDFHGINDVGMKHLSLGLIQNYSCKDLYLNWNIIGEEGSKHLARLFSKNYVLSSIYLTHNDIGKTGAKILSEALVLNRAIKCLDLSIINIGINNIGFYGAKHISSILKANTGLLKLNLGVNRIGNSGVADIGQSLIENKWLWELDLTKNNITDEGIIALVEGIKHNVALRNLILPFNYISDKGVFYLCEAMRSNYGIRFINLDSNKIDAQGGKWLAKMQAKKSSEIKISLEKNIINISEYIEYLKQEGFEQNLNE